MAKTGHSTDANKIARDTVRRKKLPALKFLGSFLGGMVLFYLFYYSSFFKNYLSAPIENFQAKIAGKILDAIGYANTVNGDGIVGSGFSVSVAKGCDGMEPLAMLLIGILVFPLAWRFKWPGLIAGVIVLFILNLLRIAACI